MAQCRTTPQEFIRDAFTPQIAVMCTPEVQKSCTKNNLDFSELLQPFSKLVNDGKCLTSSLTKVYLETISVSYKDTSGTTNIIKNLKLSFVDINARPPQTTLARKILNGSVSEAAEPKMKIHPVKNYQLEVPVLTPWFERWREAFLRVQYPSDHEFTKHYLACLLVVSSNEPSPIESMNKLVQNLNVIQSTTVPEKLPKWFTPLILKYYVVLHDNVEGNNQG